MTNPTPELSGQLPTDFNVKPWIKMPLEDLTTPRPGRLCKAPAWWAVTDDGCVLFWRSYGSPQCNTNKAIVERIRPGLRVEFIEQAFVPHRCEDYA